MSDLDAAFELSAEEHARRAGVSLEAVQLLRSSDVVDLHLDAFIPPRLVGYDLHKRHGLFLGGRFFGHLDFPRVIEGGLTGGMWSITTNIARTAGGRLRTFDKNLARFRQEIDRTGGRFRFVRSAAEYRAARADGAHAVLLSVQGGNAFEAAPDGPAAVPDRLLTRVTLVHLSNSCYGATNSPAALHRKDEGLTSKGKELVEQLNAERVFVDLAHINDAGFWSALEVHDPTQPALVTHSGVDGVCDVWRNVDDEEIKAIADTGGTIGIIFHTDFLARAGGPRDGKMVVEHMRHVIDVAGEDFVSIGTDYDGAIIPPPDLRDGALGYARLVQHMLDEGWGDERIAKILGGNFLRAFELLRPD